ncbi:leukocyte cysteine proteinase inhibitor 1-like [Centropristis striata]|uniref:leukocyte cysteine proteinase inhibitor 1-like n=1 Tax=Centropristis striata TaxID=184440 RepID=UPI0027E20A23|nr:leukocyte cysteine proteinase inhibitor 1-like [Centropristis striata]
MDQEQMVLGGWGAPEEATEETQIICDKVKTKIEEKTNAKYEVYKLVKFRSQTVAGRKFRFKLHVGGVNYIHVEVYQNIQGELRLEKTHVDKTEDDAL